MKNFNFNASRVFENITLSKSQMASLRGGDTGGQSGTNGKGEGGQQSSGPIPPQ